MSLIIAYACVLVPGLLSLDSHREPIGAPYFTLLELLIILLMPTMVALMAAVHAQSLSHSRTFALLALVFVSVLAGITCSVHFVVLTVGEHALRSGSAGMPLLFSFTWPSVVYALDALAWGVFFALAMLFAAPAFEGRGLAKWIRWLLIVSGVLALAGLSGVVTGDMRWRFVGIVGYAGVFPAAAGLMAILFRRPSASAR